MVMVNNLSEPAALQFYPLAESTRYVVGLDLGQSADPTAIAVLQHVRGVMDGRSSFERHLGLSLPTHAKAERCDVRHLERLPLGMSYPAVVQHVKDLMARPPLGGHDAIASATLVLDSTGVGNAVADIFEAAQLPHVRILITAGNETTGHGTWERQHWHVPKTALISIVDAWLHTGVLRFAAALSEAPAMRAELLDFRRSLSAAGRASYAARTGKHDDLVLAVAIGCWFLNQPPPPRAWVGSY